MAFDKTQPTNTTKLRNLGVVIRPNWDAIETADSTFIPEALNLADRTAGVIVPTDPTAITDAMIMYSKQDVAGNTQLYARDPSSNIIQLTAGLPIAADPGSSTLPGGMIIKWGSAAITSVAGGTVVGFVSVFPNNCWQVIVTPIDPNANYASVISKAVASFTARSNNLVTIGYIAIGN